MLGAMRRFACQQLFAICFCLAALPAAAHAWQERFTFDDGFQGWDFYEAYLNDIGLPNGNIVFGYDGSRIWKTFELSGAEQLVMDTHFTGADPQWMPNFVVVWAMRVNASGNPIGDKTFVYGESLVATAANPTPNPDRKRFDLTPFSGPYQVGVAWPKLACTPEDITPCLTIHFDGFIDNIFVPEPSSALLAFASAAACAGLARRQGTRRRSRTERRD